MESKTVLSMSEADHPISDFEVVTLGEGVNLNDDSDRFSGSAKGTDTGVGLAQDSGASGASVTTPVETVLLTRHPPFINTECLIKFPVLHFYETSTSIEPVTASSSSPRMFLRSVTSGSVTVEDFTDRGIAASGLDNNINSHCTSVPTGSGSNITTVVDVCSAAAWCSRSGVDVGRAVRKEAGVAAGAVAGRAVSKENNAGSQAGTAVGVAAGRAASRGSNAGCRARSAAGGVDAGRAASKQSNEGSWGVTATGADAGSRRIGKHNAGSRQAGTAAGADAGRAVSKEKNAGSRTGAAVGVAAGRAASKENNAGSRVGVAARSVAFRGSIRDSTCSLVTPLIIGAGSVTAAASSVSATSYHHKKLVNNAVLVSTRRIIRHELKRGTYKRSFTLIDKIQLGLTKSPKVQRKKPANKKEDL